MSCLDPLNSSSDLFPNFHSYLNFYRELSPLNYSPLNSAFMNPSEKHFCLLSEIHTGKKPYLIEVGNHILMAALSLSILLLEAAFANVMD